MTQAVPVLATFRTRAYRAKVDYGRHAVGRPDEER
jgi:hypothetical protein